MSSTYVHYSSPSSLPSDYAILSRYAAAHDLNTEAPTPEDSDAGPSGEPVFEDNESLDPDGVDIDPSSRRRRRSFPTSYLTSFNPTMGPLPNKSGHRTGPKPPNPTENTPLLAPLVPRIAEECDAEDAAEPPSLLKMFKEEAAILTKYTVPVFLTHLFEYSLVIASVISIGHLSTTALAASTLGSMTASVSGFSIIQGFASTLDTMLPSAWTSTQPQLVGLWSQRMMWGPDPVRLGFIGAPIATAISFNLISIISIIYGVFFVPKTAWHPLSMRCFTSLGVLVQLGLSGVGQVASEWWSWELVGLAASQLGPTALATQSVLLVSASTTYQAPFALSVASSVRIGNLLGEENAKRAAVASKCSILMSLVISAVWSTMFMVFRNSWAHLFNDDPAVVASVASILPLVALFQVFDGLSAITAGVLRAVGKQFTGALLNLSAYYVVGIPFGIWLAFWKGMDLHGLWIGLTVSLVYCAAVGVWLCFQTDWERQVEKVRIRLAADSKASDAERQH
ncbi:hypothetical protein TRAPUB_8619 [Trametes pubescens]|uniref:Transporter C11D3.06 n=1 Tax=Trametes pubescens TaxID=154538 RepID=A0A1M2W4M9_TRAPU|nr:hypothetical protein TRAPUB_8619 [Trametes pubescens]